MTKNISFSVRLDSKLKADAEELFGELGLSLGSAMNIFLRQSVRLQGLPFSIRIGKNAESRQDEAAEAEVVDAEVEEAQPETKKAKKTK